MGVLLRTLLIWLLVLAVPAQGAAAVAMVSCGPSHHTGGTARAQASAAVSEHAHPGDDASGHHVHSGVSAHAAHAAVPDGVPAFEAPGQADKQKCSACASCCSMGAILTTVPALAAADPAPTVFTTVVPTVDAFAADGPDRPPRNLRV